MEVLNNVVDLSNFNKLGNGYYFVQLMTKRLIILKVFRIILKLILEALNIMMLNLRLLKHTHRRAQEFFTGCAELF